MCPRITRRVAVIGLLAGVVLPSLLTGACGAAGSAPSAKSTAASSLTAGESAANTVTLGRSSFTRSSLTISVGQTLRFVDPANTGGPHRLCLGTGGECAPRAQGPAELHAPGLSFSPGEAKDILFSSLGRLRITCTIHPHMLLMVTVVAAGE